MPTPHFQQNTDASDTRAKKSLGQHWLTSRAAVEKMCLASGVRSGETVVEIGPGKGILTHALLQRDVSVLAIEKDKRMMDVLRGRFAQEIEDGTLTLLEADALAWVWQGNGSYRIVANIPYYVTGALVRHFLTAATQPQSMTLLVQKEVAERIARSKKESVLSLSVKAFGSPTFVATVKAGSFSPPPKVDSAILHIADISRAHFSDPNDEKRFFTLVKAGFSAKRKTLAGNLRIAFTDPAAALAAAGIPPRARAEDVPLHQWLQLSRAPGAK